MQLAELQPFQEDDENLKNYFVAVRPLSNGRRVFNGIFREVKLQLGDCFPDVRNMILEIKQM